MNKWITEEKKLPRFSLIRNQNKAYYRYIIWHVWLHYKDLLEERTSVWLAGANKISE